MDNLGKNWQLINILFCGYQRRLEIGDCRSTKCAETYTRPGHSAPASNYDYTFLHIYELQMQRTYNDTCYTEFKSFHVLGLSTSKTVFNLLV